MSIHNVNVILRAYQEKLNAEPFKFIRNHGDYFGVTRAQVYSPTGSGKTVCFTELILELAKEVEALGLRPLSICVVHPRLSLSQEQVKRFKETFKTTVNFTSFHSGQHPRGEERVRELNTTKEHDLIKLITSSWKNKKTHITFSSYNSFSKINERTFVDTGRAWFDLVIIDEAHNLVSSEFNKLIKNCVAPKILTYTATPITRESNEHSDIVGMGDTSVFGEVIATLEPKELISRGYLVAPIRHYMKCEISKRKGSIIDIVDATAGAFAYQHSKIVGPDLMSHHCMMVAARDVAIDLRENIDKRIDELKTKIFSLTCGNVNPESLEIYTIGNGEVFKNGEKFGSDRFEAIDEIKKTRNKNVIVLHYDTMGEGIDIDNLSGVLVMRKLGKVKLIQFIGRPARPHVDDLGTNKEPIKLSDSNYSPKKPNSIITFPIVNDKWLGDEDCEFITDAFVNGGYEDLVTEEFSVADKPQGKKRDIIQNDDDTKEQSSIKSYDHESVIIAIREIANAINNHGSQ